MSLLYNFIKKCPNLIISDENAPLPTLNQTLLSQNQIENLRASTFQQLSIELLHFQDQN